ncbi:MAG: hypothetical protein LBL04_10705 [Bacteroidales bacterium]|jgi:hypothetical protein|nr:hypothetical protein [Bacteroidales bacterium]
MIRKKIELREERDFGQKFNAVFTFVQSNFKPFIKVIGLTVGPLALVGGFFFGLVYSKMLGMIGMVESSNMALLNMAELSFVYFFLGLASLWMMIAVYAYMAEYESGNENITIEAVWRRGKGKIWPTIGFALLIWLAMVIFVVIIFILPGNNAGGIVLKMLLAIAVILYVLITLSLVVPNMVIEGDGLFESIGRSFTLIRGKWWSTFGIMMIMGIVASFATMIFAIPFYIAMIVKMLMQLGELGTLFMVISSSIMFLGSYLMTVLPALAIGFQYFNLVERKEGTGLLKKIDRLGKPVHEADEGEF